MALAPVVLLVALLGADVVYFGEDSSYGSNQIALLLAALFAGVLGMTHGTKWSEMKDAIAQSIGTATEAVLILLLIGALSGTWLLAGIIPAFIHYGMTILQPSIFLFAACIVCAMLSLAQEVLGAPWAPWASPLWALVMLGLSRAVAEPSSAELTSATKCRPSDTTNLLPLLPAPTSSRTSVHDLHHWAEHFDRLDCLLGHGFGGGAV